MAITDYYGRQTATTRLDIYSINGESKVVHRSLSDQEAYDTWHLALYFKEILECRKLMESDFSFDLISRKEKHLIVYLLLAANPQLQSVTELGSSLFEMIDGLEVLTDYKQKKESLLPQLKVDNITFLGVELSDLLAQASKELHKNHNVQTHKELSKLPSIEDGLLYDRNVTSYAFDNTDELAFFMNKFDISYCNLYFNKGHTFHTSRLGKCHTYFSLESLVDKLDKPLFHLFGIKAPGPKSGELLSLGNDVVEGFFLNCSGERANEFISLSSSIPEVKDWFTQKDIRLTPALNLLDTKQG